MDDKSVRERETVTRWCSRPAFYAYRCSFVYSIYVMFMSHNTVAVRPTIAVAPFRARVGSGPPQPSWRRRVSNSMRQTMPSQSDRSPEKKHPIASAASPDPSSSKAVSELVEEVKASRDAMRLATAQLNLLLERADGLLKSTSRTNQEERGLDA